MSDTGKTIALIKALAPSPEIDPEQVKQDVEDWLDEHPEATTTVEDGSITKAKLNASLQGTVDDVDDLKSAITTFEYYTYTDDDLTTDNSYIGITDGALRSDSTNFHNSKLVTIPQDASNIIINRSGTITGGAVIAFYTGYKFSSTTYISGVTVQDTSALPISVPIPSNAVYMAFTGRKADTFEAVLNVNKVAVNSFERKNGIDLKLSAGNVGSDGTITYGATTVSNYVSKLIPKADYRSIRIVPNAGYLCNYAYFNNGTFVSRGSWVGSTETLEIDNEYDCILLLACETTATKTAGQMLAEYSIQIIGTDELQKAYSTLYSAEKNIESFAGNVLSATTCGKVIHYSLDDSYRALRRLITEEATYTSIFDNYIFGRLKEVHEQTGAKFTMNVILDIEDFDITLVPDKFASDFQANKDWLKFAYHDLDGDHSETTYAAMASAYQTFVSNVYRFTGTYDCIDTMPRLDGFVGNISVVKAMQDNNAAPIVGLLSADDARNSYYLSSAQSAIARNKGKYFDFDNNMVFIRSATRLDSASAAELIAEIEANPCYQNFVEVWFHEGIVGDPSVEKLLTIGAWANSKGYNNYYPYEIFTFE